MKMSPEEIAQYKGVFVFAQQVDNEISGIAFELLGKAKELAAPLNTEVTAVLIGSDVKNLADTLAEYGADKVIVVDDPELKVYRTEPYAHALASVINEFKPEIVLVGATAIGRDLGPTVSARVATGLTADCTVLEIGDFPINAIPGRESEQKHNQLLMTRPAFGGNTIATIACPDNRPQMATVRPGVMQKISPIAGAKAEVIEFILVLHLTISMLLLKKLLKLYLISKISWMLRSLYQADVELVQQRTSRCLMNLQKFLADRLAAQEQLLITAGSQKIFR